MDRAVFSFKLMGMGKAIHYTATSQQTCSSFTLKDIVLSMFIYSHWFIHTDQHIHVPFIPVSCGVYILKCILVCDVPE